MRIKECVATGFEGERDGDSNTYILSHPSSVNTQHERDEYLTYTYRLKADSLSKSALSGGIKWREGCGALSKPHRMPEVTEADDVVFLFKRCCAPNLASAAEKLVTNPAVFSIGDGVQPHQEINNGLPGLEESLRPKISFAS